MSMATLSLNCHRLSPRNLEPSVPGARRGSSAPRRSLLSSRTFFRRPRFSCSSSSSSKEDSSPASDGFSRFCSHISFFFCLCEFWLPIKFRKKDFLNEVRVWSFFLLEWKSILFGKIFIFFFLVF